MTVDLIPVSGQDMLRIPPGPGEKDFIPLTSSPLAAVPPGSSARIRAPAPAYDLRPRNRHLDPNVALALIEEVEVLQTPSRKRAATMGT